MLEYDWCICPLTARNSTPSRFVSRRSRVSFAEPKHWSTARIQPGLFAKRLTTSFRRHCAMNSTATPATIVRSAKRRVPRRFRRHGFGSISQNGPPQLPACCLISQDVFDSISSWGLSEFEYGYVSLLLSPLDFLFFSRTTETFPGSFILLYT